MIQWYPGHMAKAKRMLEENLQLIDVVIEMVDARIPISSKNPDFDKLFSSKTRMVLLNKSDLVDNDYTSRWVDYYKSKNITVKSVSSITLNNKNSIISLIKEAAAPAIEKMKSRGVTKTVRVLVCGIPNVGKSTFINHLAGKNYAKVGNKPGVTKGKQWIKLDKYLEVMDSPGLLWPKLDNETCSNHLAYVLSINEDITDKETLSVSLLKELFEICPEDVSKKFPSLSKDSADYLIDVCKDCHFLLSNGEYDQERAANHILDAYRTGKITKVCLEFPDIAETYHAQN